MERNMNKVIIPEPLQITVDDLGWFCGKDARDKMEPSRTGITRRHCAEDYETVNEIGRRLGMKINAAMILAEWDPDNRLKNIPGLSPCGNIWDNASYFDKKEAKRCAEAINSSQYIDIAIHGLQHSYYIPGNAYNNSDFYYIEDKVWKPITEQEVRMRLDAWYDLMEYNGIKKCVNSFIPPNCVYEWNHLSKILKDYNILYISTILKNAHPFRENVSMVEIEDGIIVIDRKNNFIPWDEMESNLDNLPVASGIFACHWANMCHKEPKNNYTLVDSWVNYFRRAANQFGVIISKSMSLCATQSVYKKYSKISEKNGVFIVDISNVPKTIGLEESFYISAKQPIKKWKNCDVEFYEKRGDFINYKITPKDRILTLNRISI